MKIIYLFLFAVLSTVVDLPVLSQTYRGKVVDTHKKSVEYVSVVLLDQAGSPVNFSHTEADGTFSIAVPEGKRPVNLSFTMIGYEKVVMPLDDFKNGQTVTMSEKKLQIKEVRVTSHRIRQSQDTLTYSVAGFRQKQDRTIADVIAKMPGLEVKSDGSIEYQGTRINNFLIEGMDLLGSKYSQASENLSANKVKDVQVLRNHQPIKALRNVKFSDQAALNIVLKDSAKDVWCGVADVSSGLTLQGSTDWLRDCRLVEMIFSKKMQSISLYKCNNTGKDIQHEVMDLINSDRSIEGNDGILSLMTLSNPSIDQNRYSFNDTHLFATNWLFKTAGDNNLKIQLNALLDKSRQNQYKETLYSDVNNSGVLTEESSVRNTRSEWKGEMLYKINKSHFYLNNNLSGYADFNKSEGMTVLNGSDVKQLIRPRKRYLSDDFEIIHNLSGDKSISFSSLVNYGYYPGYLLLSDGSQENLNLHSLVWDTYTYFNHKLAGFYITYKGGFKVKSQNMDTYNKEISSNDKYREYRWYLTPSINYKHNGLNVEAMIPLDWLTRSYNGKNKSIALSEPSISVVYEMTSKIKYSLSYSYKWTPADISSISSSPIYKDYITVCTSTGDFEKTMSHQVMSSLEYCDPLLGFFTNCSFNYHKQLNALLYKSVLTDGVYRRTATGMHADNDSYTVSGKVSETFNWAKTYVSLSGTCMWNNYEMLLSDVITPYQMLNSEIEFDISFRPVQLFSFEETSTYEYNEQKNRSDGTMAASPLHTFYHKLKTFFLPGNWQVEWDNECYHSNDKSVSFNFFSDLSVSYRTSTYEIGLSSNNIFGNKNYEHRYITDNQQIYTLNRLRPREILAKFSFDL